FFNNDGKYLMNKPYDFNDIESTIKKNIKNIDMKDSIQDKMYSISNMDINNDKIGSNHIRLVIKSKAICDKNKIETKVGIDPSVKVSNRSIDKAIDNQEKLQNLIH